MTLTVWQSNFLVVAYDYYRRERLHGQPELVNLPSSVYGLLGDSTRVAAMKRLGYLDDLGHLTRHGIDTGREQFAAVIGLDPDLLFESEIHTPGRADPSDPQVTGGLFTFALADFVTTAFTIALTIASPGYTQALAWHCIACGDGKAHPDRVEHWRWHRRTAETVHSIDWANPRPVS